MNISRLNKWIGCSLLLFLVTNQLFCKNNVFRQELNVNSNWAFYRGDIKQAENIDWNDSKWIPIVLPHIMQLEKKHCGGGEIYDGIGWYRRYFRLPQTYAGKRTVLSFEGVMNTCDVFINGEKVTTHHGGYMGFTVDISDKIRYGDHNNVLAVRVSAEHDPLTPPGKPQEKMDFYYYSGIYRDVKMVITDKLHITDELEKGDIGGGGIFVTYPHVDKEKALVRIKTNLSNGHTDTKKGSLLTLLKDKRGKIVASQQTDFELSKGCDNTIEQILTVISPQLWHPYHPNLYTLDSRVISGHKVVDCRTEEIGIRLIRYTTDKGFFINGEHLYLIGANRHQAFPNIGDAASNSMQERDVIDMKRGGYNAVRAAHYPQDPAFLAACDKHGLLVVECIPGWQYFNSNDIFSDRLEQAAREMIRRDRNHPSVILWETALNETHYPLSIVKRIYDAAHEEYPGDQFYTAGDYFSHEDTEPYYDVFYKQVSRYPKDGNVMTNSLDDQITVKPLLTREWGDGAGEKPRVSILESEQEQMRQCRSRYRQLNGDGYFDWCMLDANPRMGGHFMWSYNDYARGAEDETMFSGVVDINRYPKFSYYMMQSMRLKDISQPGLYDGPMVHIASFNSSANFPSSTTEITVFSNCDEVLLYRNNHLIGRQTRKEQTPAYRYIVEKGGSPCYIFNANDYEQGELKAEGLVNGKVVALHTVHTPGKSHHIIVEIPEHGIKPIADGSDMIPVYFKICDARGTIVNTSDAEITVHVSGEGTLIGDGINRIGINPQKVEAGIGFALIRTTSKAGKIKISASSKDLQSGETVIRTLSFKGKNLPDGSHSPFTGKEEDGVIIKPAKWERSILAKPKAEIAETNVSSSQNGYPLKNITDNDDFTWWIAGDDSFPQVITLELTSLTPILASRVRFQKDSSTYTHKVETSTDGIHWEQLYERSCTGWDFKPVTVNKSLKYFRLTIKKASEGRAGLAEITLYKEK